MPNSTNDYQGDSLRLSLKFLSQRYQRFRANWLYRIRKSICGSNYLHAMFFEHELKWEKKVSALEERVKVLEKIIVEQGLKRI